MPTPRELAAVLFWEVPIVPCAVPPKMVGKSASPSPRGLSGQLRSGSSPTYSRRRQLPWARNSELPRAVRDALPDAAQSRFRQGANERMGAGAGEQSAIAQAWHVVGQGWSKPKDGGKWVRKQDDLPTFRKTEVIKVDEELGLVFGFAIVCKVGSEPYFDLQRDHIPEDAMLKAAADFMQHSRTAKEMHSGDQIGDIVFAFPLTGEIAKAMEITTKHTGLLVAMKPSPAVLVKFKTGEYSGFSIGGKRVVDEDVE